MYRVTLTTDAVTVIEPFSQRQLLCAQIRGRRLLGGQQGLPTLVLVPKDDTAKRLRLSLVLKTDRAFDAWIARLPDIDQEERDRSAQEVAQALYPDHLPHERGARIKRLRQLAKWVTGATIALSIAAFFLPDYSVLTATLIVLPWLAVWLVARFQPLYRFGARRNDAHPDFTAALMLPGLSLTVYALTDVHTFDWAGPAMLTACGGLVLGGAALRVDPWFRQQRATAILTCLFVFAYGYGAGLEIDVLADSAKPVVYMTEVLAKRVFRGRKSNTYYLRVKPWGPITDADEITVPAGRYGATRTGDTVCVYVGEGAFRVSWYQVRDCPQGYIRQSL
jgi:hypothetical protein